MMMTGEQYKASLDDGRATYFEGQRVQDLPGHPLLGSAADRVADGYDWLAGQAVEKHRWRVVPGALRRLFETKPGTIRVEMDGTAVEAHSRIVTVSNAPLMGNNLLVAPDAKMDDGWLDITIYDGMGDAALIQHFMSAGGGTSNPLKTYRARHVRITSDEPVLANSDKDMAGQQRVIEIEIVPRALSMIVGNGIGLSLPMESAPRGSVSVAEPAPHANGAVDAPVRIGQ